MNLNNSKQRFILFGLLRIISHIANKNYQIRIWIRNQGPECQAFDDATCDFLVIGGAIINEFKAFNLQENQLNKLISLYEKFQHFVDKHNMPEEFIDTPEWDAIVEMAKEVLRAFHYHQEAAE